MARRKKTPLQRAIEKRKKAAKRQVSRTKKQVRKRVRKTTKTFKRTRKKLTKRGRKLVRVSKRRGKKLRKRAKKRVRTFKRNRAKAIRRQYTRRNIGDPDDAVLTSFTSDKTKANDQTAFLPDYGNDSGASNPGEPPKKRTGNGQKAISAELISHKKKNEVFSRTYVDKRKAAYMAMWEYRKDGKQRPFLKPSLEHNRKLLGDIIGQSLKQKLKQAGRRK